MAGAGGRGRRERERKEDAGCWERGEESRKGGRTGGEGGVSSRSGQGHTFVITTSIVLFSLHISVGKSTNLKWELRFITIITSRIMLIIITYAYSYICACVCWFRSVP